MGTKGGNTRVLWKFFQTLQSLLPLSLHKETPSRVLSSHSLSPKGSERSPQRWRPFSTRPSPIYLRWLIDLCAQAYEPTTRDAVRGTCARIIMNRPPVDTLHAVLILRQLASTKGTSIPVIVADLMHRSDAHRAALDGGRKVVVKFEVGGQKIGKLIRGAVCERGVVDGCLRGRGR